MFDGTTTKSTPVLPKSIRLATERDEPALLSFLLALDVDNGFGVPVSRKRVLDHIRLGTERKGMMIGVIDGPDGQIIASTAVLMTQPWYSDLWCFHELWLFVRPEHRAAGHHKDLFAFLEYCRASMTPQDGHPWYVLTSVWSLNRLPARLRLWRRFAKPIAGVFLMSGE